MRSAARIRIALALLIVFAASAAAWAAHVTAVETVGFTVADMDRSIAFYTNVLDFKKVSDSKVQLSLASGSKTGTVRVVLMQLGDEGIELTQYLNAPGRPFPAGSRGNDRWFQHVAIITSDMDRAYERLRTNHVRHVSNAPQTLPAWNRNAAGIRAFYFSDPDGHFLEVLQFPPDKGLQKWHHTGDELFLGIDHTAIVVADTDSSLRFYRDELGMRVAGESDNYGVEQEHLNGVFGAHLRITALRAEQGPGIELLEYLSPTDGRAYPADAKANDIVHWEIRLVSEDEEKSSALNVGRSFAAARKATNNRTQKDPDGHVVVFRTAMKSTQSKQGGN